MSKWVKFDKHDKTTWPSYTIPLSGYGQHFQPEDGDRCSYMNTYVLVYIVEKCKIHTHLVMAYLDSYGIFNHPYFRYQTKESDTIFWRELIELPSLDYETCTACSQEKSKFKTDSIEKDPYSTCAVCGEIITNQED